MKSITIHNLDDALSENIRLKAIERGKSINSTIKEMLSRALGLDPGQDEKTAAKARGYARFLGLWSEEDELSFKVATADFERIDEDEWHT